MIKEKKQIDRRKFIQSTAILATVPVLAGSPTENLGKTEQKYPTVVEILSSLAPSSLQKKNQARSRFCYGTKWGFC